MKQVVAHMNGEPALLAREASLHADVVAILHQIRKDVGLQPKPPVGATEVHVASVEQAPSAPSAPAPRQRSPGPAVGLPASGLDAAALIPAPEPKPEPREARFPVSDLEASTQAIEAIIEGEESSEEPPAGTLYAELLALGGVPEPGEEVPEVPEVALLGAAEAAWEASAAEAPPAVTPDSVADRSQSDGGGAQPSSVPSPAKRGAGSPWRCQLAESLSPRPGMPTPFAEVPSAAAPAAAAAGLLASADSTDQVGSDQVGQACQGNQAVASFQLPQPKDVPARKKRRLLPASLPGQESLASFGVRVPPRPATPAEATQSAASASGQIGGWPATAADSAGVAVAEAKEIVAKSPGKSAVGQIGVGEGGGKGGGKGKGRGRGSRGKAAGKSPKAACPKTPKAKPAAKPKANAPLSSRIWARFPPGGPPPKAQAPPPSASPKAPPP